MTTSHYDAAQNLIRGIDAKGQTTTYQYDALNRVTRETRHDGTVVAYTYDQGANGIGRLTGMSDPSGSTAWRYDAHGRVVEKAQAVGAVSGSLRYAYDAAGRLAAVTYPSGRVVQYSINNGQVSAVLLNGSVLAGNITWQPFGAARSWIFGNVARKIRTSFATAVGSKKIVVAIYGLV